MNIYRCECWLDSYNVITIPFCMRAEIGLPAFIAAFKKQYDLPATTTVAEVTNLKTFKFVSPLITARYLQMNPQSVARLIGVQDAKPYQHIILASVPRPTDKDVYLNPDPTRPWLEMMMQEDCNVSLNLSS
mgnify:FL=1